MQRSAQDLQDLSVLLVYAHPDDEGFATGGILALLAGRGARLTLVCATNGDVGEISDPVPGHPGDASRRYGRRNCGRRWQ